MGKINIVSCLAQGIRNLFTEMMGLRLRSWRFNGCYFQDVLKKCEDEKFAISVTRQNATGLYFLHIF